MISWVAGLLLAVLCAGTVSFIRPPSQHLSIAGATGSLAYLRRAVAGWEAEHPGCTVSISGGGSIAGLVEVSRGRVDIGVSDVAPRHEWTGGRLLNFRPLGKIPLLVIAHPGVGVRQLSLSQAALLFQGRVHSWTDIGGRALPVVVMTRPLASGALDVLQERLLKGHRVSSRSIVELSNGAMLAAVRETPGAIGFVESGRTPSRVAVLGLENWRYSAANPRAWPYAVEPTIYWRPEAGSLTESLAIYLASRAYRSGYGIFPHAS